MSAETEAIILNTTVQEAGLADTHTIMQLRADIDKWGAVAVRAGIEAVVTVDQLNSKETSA